VASAVHTGSRITPVAAVAAALFVWLPVTGSRGRAADGPSSPDLTVVAASDAAGSVARGAELRYTVTVSNVGAVTAHDVAATVRLPHRVKPIHLLPTMDGGVCSVTGSTEPGALYSAFCTRRTLPGAASAAVTIDVRIDPHRPCGSMRAVATVSAEDEPAALRADDTTTRVDTVACEASIAVEGPGRAFARAGAVVRLPFVVTNDGDLTLHGLELDGPGCSGAPLVGLLHPGGHRAIGCRYRVPTSTDGAFRLGVLARSPDGSTVRASAVARFTPISPSIALSISIPRLTGRVGSTVSYRIVVRNVGDSPLHDVTLRRSSAGSIRHIAWLPAGGAETVWATEALRTAGAHPIVITATARDRSGGLVSAQASALVTVSAERAPTPPATAFTGDPAAAAGLVAMLLAVSGAIALVLARRRLHPVTR